MAVRAQVGDQREVNRKGHRFNALEPLDDVVVAQLEVGCAQACNGSTPVAH